MRIVLMAAAAFLLIVNPSSAQQVDEGTATKAVEAYAQAVSRGNRDALAGVLAPEFQIMRANGVRRNLDEYLAGFPASHTVSGDFEIEGMRATGTGGVMVASYNLRIEETIDGSLISRLAPRLTVFRLIDGEWKVVSHANFAVVPEAK